ncbi:hypothetical protein DFJ77DRAFT_467688 [Powellomyces hirtus]|nr:hypothetical protein DFJ77DRAFT_467688 [Powellomyces hirtus]
MGTNKKTVTPIDHVEMSTGSSHSPTHAPHRPPRNESRRQERSGGVGDLESGATDHHRTSRDGRRNSTSSTVTYQSSNFDHPHGEVGIDPEHKTTVKVFGRTGFAAKAVIYGVLGGLLIRVAAGGNEDSSPQGVFVLVGDNNVGIPLLVIMAIALAFYVVWRWWEAFTGQGSDASFSKKKNFFKYRVSPFVSGAVYAAYTYYVIKTIFTSREQRRSEDKSADTTQSAFPDSWTSAGVHGKIGVAFLGILFLVATLIQWQVAITAPFRRELYQNKLENKFVRTFIHTIGRIGFTARGFLFMLVAVLMFRSVGSDEDDADVDDPTRSITGKAVNALSTKWWGKAILIIIGSGLLIYSIFALSNVYYKIFPTPPPSRKPAIDEDKEVKDKQEAAEEAAEARQS